jgi:hypothetical protein
MRTATITIACVIISMVMISKAIAQPRFEVPLAVTDGSSAQTLYFGFFPGAHYCFHPADSMGCRECSFLPPPPPGGIFDARLVLPRGTLGDSCCSFSGGSLCDYRPSTSATQKDTFKIKSQLGAGTRMVLSWPAGLSAYFTQLTLRYFDQVLQQNVNTDMLRDTTAEVTDAGDPATMSILSGGLVTSVDQTSSHIPARFALNQNYPNPFNPATNCQFSIANRQLTILKVYDVLGQEVATLVNEVKQPGTYTVQWDASGVASGVYFYRLQAGGFVQTKKLLLLR